MKPSTMFPNYYGLFNIVKLLFQTAKDIAIKNGYTEIAHLSYTYEFSIKNN